MELAASAEVKHVTSNASIEQLEATNARLNEKLKEAEFTTSVQKTRSNELEKALQTSKLALENLNLDFEAIVLQRNQFIEKDVENITKLLFLRKEIEKKDVELADSLKTIEQFKNTVQQNVSSVNTTNEKLVKKIQTMQDDIDSLRKHYSAAKNDALELRVLRNKYVEAFNWFFSALDRLGAKSVQKDFFAKTSSPITLDLVVSAHELSEAATILTKAGLINTLIEAVSPSDIESSETDDGHYPMEA